VRQYIQNPRSPTIAAFPTTEDFVHRDLVSLESVVAEGPVPVSVKLEREEGPRPDLTFVNIVLDIRVLYVAPEIRRSATFNSVQAGN